MPGNPHPTAGLHWTLGPSEASAMVEKRKGKKKKSTHPPNSGVKENSIHPDFQKENVPPQQPRVHRPLPGSCEPERQIFHGLLSGHVNVPGAICPHLCVKQFLSLEIPPGRRDGERGLIRTRIWRKTPRECSKTQQAAF